MLAARTDTLSRQALLFQDADANFRNSAGETAMVIAERRGKVEVIDLLKRAGARQ